MALVRQMEYTNSLVNAIFGSGIKLCYINFMLSKLVGISSEEIKEFRVSEGIIVS